MWATLGMCVLLLAAILVLGRRVLSTLSSVGAMAEIQRPPAHTLVMLLSVPNHQQLSLEGGELRVGGRSPAGPWEWWSPKPVFDDAVPWNWLQLCRCATQLPEVQRIVLIPSPASAEHGAAAVALLRWVFARRVAQGAEGLVQAEGAVEGQAPDITLSSHSPDFASLAAVRDAVRHELSVGGGVAAIVDVTGGTKTASIAAAVAALDADALLGYVEGGRLRTYAIGAERHSLW